MNGEGVKRAIVIGASSGIGQEVARLLVADGYLVGVTGRRSDLLETLCAESPGNYVSEAFDVSASDALARLETLIARMDGVDLVVFCAGTGYLNPELEMEPELDTVSLNVTAFTRVVDFVYRYFSDRDGGHLVAITSVMGLRGSGPAPAYAATKAYQINYLEGLRQRACKRKESVTVTDIRPGSVDTAMMKGEGHFWIASPRRAAEVILRAVRARKQVQYVTPRWRIVGLLLKMIPRGVYKKM